MEVVKAGIAHCDAVYDLICALEGRPMDRQALSAVYARNLEKENIHYFVAVDGERVAGFVSLHVHSPLHHAALVGEIQEIIVSPAQQGGGVGALLFDRAREEAARLGCIQMEVSCHRSRERSHRFYERQGMEKTHYKFVLPLA